MEGRECWGLGGNRVWKLSNLTAGFSIASLHVLNQLSGDRVTPESSFVMGSLVLPSSSSFGWLDDRCIQSISAVSLVESQKLITCWSCPCAKPFHCPTWCLETVWMFIALLTWIPTRFLAPWLLHFQHTVPWHLLELIDSSESQATMQLGSFWNVSLLFHWVLSAQHQRE